MKKVRSYNISKYVIKHMLLSFIMVIVIIWLNEIIDVPYLFFGADITPVNWKESVFESASIIILAIIVLRYTGRLFSRIKVLEGILYICASCKRIRDVDGSWHELEDYITERSDSQFSHSLCPECVKKLYPDFK